MRRVFSILFVVGLIGINPIGAQDFHLSQYDAASININPAMTGMFSGAYRIHGHYRTQWSAISTRPYTTALIAGDKSWGDWSAGAQVANFNAGAGKYNVFGAQLSGAYDYAFDQAGHHHVSLGLAAGFIQKSIDQSELYFGSQYQISGGGYFDTSIPSGETFSSTSVSLHDVSAGLMYYYGNEYSRINPFIGVSAFHLTEPKESFFSTDNQLPMRWLVHAGAKINITNDLQILPKVFSMHQRNARELTFSAMAHYYVDAYDAYILFGPTFRLSGQLNADAIYEHENDAAILELGIKYGQFTGRVSYDINTSNLKPYSNGRGAFEISLTYIATSRKPNPVKNCPRL